MKFKYVLIAAATLMMGFASCGSDNEVGGEDVGGTKDVTIRVTKPSTYAEEATADGVTPDVNDATLFFINSAGIVMEQGTMNAAEIADKVNGKTFLNIPADVNKVVLVGNSTALTSPTFGTINNETQFNAVMLEQSAQTHAKTAVNVQGTAAIAAGTGNITVTVQVRPAISRIEIGEVKVKTGVGVGIELASFKLTGIYINNTYTKLGLDYSTLPTLATEILNYGLSAPEFTNTSYPARYKDEWAEAGVTNAASFTPTVVTDKWSYFVMPPVAGKGTTINGEQKTSVPHILIKVENAIKASDNSQLYATPKFLTIRKLIDNSTLNELTHLLPGRVYKITAIEVDGKDLGEPEGENRDITVLVDVLAWEGVDVTPGL
ncbi:MAG: hypothetical protein E6767_11925 [Dysgonomonas sp.]|nr:hypothetical protein [Dysgonomonas sp.]